MQGLRVFFFGSGWPRVFEWLGTRGSMTLMAKSKERVPVGAGGAPLTQSLSDSLAGHRDRMPAAPPNKTAEACAPAGAALRAGLAGAKKLVVRRERKGHGGKTATRIEGLSGPPKDLETLASDIRRAFGCGSAVDGEDVVVQGDQTDRLVAWLQARTAVRVVVGN